MDQTATATTSSLRALAARHPYVAGPSIGILTFVTALIVAQASDLPLRDPDGVLGSPLIFIAVLLGVFFLLDVVPRVAKATRLRPSLVRAEFERVISARWGRRRTLLVVSSLLGFYLTYVGYRNLKSFLPFFRDQNLDIDFAGLDRSFALGHEPMQVLHDLLGTGVAAHVLSSAYLLYLPGVPISLGVALVWSRHIRPGLWYVTAVNINWVAGVISYYALPSVGPAFAVPQSVSGLPETGVGKLQASLVADRASVLAAPNAADGVQSIAAFASLHVSIVVSALIVAHAVRAPRAIRVFLWIYLPLVVMATMYFGWHYIIDDIGGLAIGVFSVFAAAALTGFDPKLPRLSGGRAPLGMQARA